MNWLLPLLMLLIPLLTAMMIFSIPKEKSFIRNCLNLVGAGSNVVLIVFIMWGVYHGDAYELKLEVMTNLNIVFRLYSLSLLFASLSSILWLVTTVYAIGYFQDPAYLNRFFGFFSLCVASTIGVAIAGNIFTFFIFYELLTLCTYPLVVHRGTSKALAAGRVYLLYTIVGSACFLVGIIWLNTLVGTPDFTTGGYLNSVSENSWELQCIFVFLMIGTGVKAAIFPLHGWLPRAMVAPAPVSALLHAVAVVKAGAFGIARIVYDVYGVHLLHDLGLAIVLTILAATTIVFGSVCALREDDLKKRLAYSTVSQVSYIALGVSLFSPIAAIGGLVHIVHQGLMKITLFFCAGNLAESLHIHKVSEMDGTGQKMPWTMAAFTIASLGMIGVPPIAGFVSKWYLGTGALASGQSWVVVILVLSSWLNSLYFLPIIHRVWFKPPAEDLPSPRISWALLIPPVFTALSALAVGFFANFSLSPLAWCTRIAKYKYGEDIFPYLDVSGGLFLEQIASVVFVICLFTFLFVLTKRFAAHHIFLVVNLIPATLLLAGFVIPDQQITLPWLLLKTSLGWDAISRPIGMTASILWLMAGFFAHHYLRQDSKIVRFAFYYSITMLGNLGVIVALDMISFYFFFALMTFGAYGLIIHSENSKAIRASRIYLTISIAGEGILLATIFWVQNIAGDVSFAVTANKIADHASGSTIAFLIFISFAIKMGVFPLHCWLPLAHPAAPVPASAVLSGIIIKAGLIGWIRFLPLGLEDYFLLGILMICLGLFSAFYGVGVGLSQKNSKAVLAYSSISQMGLITSAIGVALIWPASWTLVLISITLMLIHHAFAKSSLFLGVAMASWECLGNKIWFVRVGILVAALALVGFPMTSGSIAKYALKSTAVDTVFYPYYYWLLLFSSIATTMIMSRFVEQIWKTDLKQQKCGSFMWGSWVTLLLGVLVGPWIWFFSQESLVAGVKFYKISFAWAAFWPVLLGGGIYFAVRTLIPQKFFYHIPEGDILQLIPKQKEKWLNLSQEASVSLPSRSLWQDGFAWLTKLEKRISLVFVAVFLVVIILLLFATLVV